MNHLRFALLLLTFVLFSTSCYRKQAITTEENIDGNKRKVIPMWKRNPTYFRSVFRFSLWGSAGAALGASIPLEVTVNGQAKKASPAILGSIFGLLMGGIATFWGPDYKTNSVKKDDHLEWVKSYNQVNKFSYNYLGNEDKYLFLGNLSNKPNVTERKIEPISTNTMAESPTINYKIRHALIIGNSQYRTLMPIPNAINDVNIVAKALGILGFKTTVLNDFTSSQFDEKWTYFKQDANNTEVLLIYYVGHGMAFEGNNYFLPVETNIKNCNDVRRQGIKVSELIEDISKLNSKINLFYLDSFQQNNVINCTQLNTHTTTTDEILVRKRGVRLAEKSTIPNLMFYNASQGDGAMPSVGKNGHFTKAFIDNLKIGIDSDELMRKITNSVLIKTNQKQLPETSGSLMDTFIF